MAFSSGTFTFTSNSFAPSPVTGTTISSTAAASTWTELATALSTCLLKDGTQTVTANIPMATFKFTGLGAGSANGNSVRYEQIIGVVTTAGDIVYATAAGTFARLGIGTARQQLATNSGATAPEWVASLQSLMTAQGDIVQASAANTPARLGIGAAGSVLAVNAGATAVAYQAMATQADQETSTSLIAPVTPGRQHFHPSAAKAWAKGNFAGALQASYNLTSITDTGVGQQTYTWDTDFSSANYCVVVSNISGSRLVSTVDSGTPPTAGAVLIVTRDEATANADADNTCVVAFGDQ